MIMDMTVIQQERSITAIKGGGKNEKKYSLGLQRQYVLFL